MIAELPANEESPLHAWVTPGQPCVGVYVPVFPPHAVPPALGRPAVWEAFASLRDRVEAEPQTLEEIRAVFDPIETDLWEEAAEVPDDVSSQQTFVEEAWKRVEAALEVLVRAGAAT